MAPDTAFLTTVFERSDTREKCTGNEICVPYTEINFKETSSLPFNVID